MKSDLIKLPLASDRPNFTAQALIDMAKDLDKFWGAGVPDMRINRFLVRQLARAQAAESVTGEGLHYFAFAFNDGRCTASVYIGYPDKQVCMRRIQEAKAEAGVSVVACMISCSYLGLMTPDEFRGGA